MTYATHFLLFSLLERATLSSKIESIKVGDTARHRGIASTKTVCQDTSHHSLAAPLLPIALPSHEAHNDAGSDLADGLRTFAIEDLLVQRCGNEDAGVWSTIATSFSVGVRVFFSLQRPRDTSQ